MVLWSFHNFDSLLNNPFVSELKEEKYNILNVYLDFTNQAGYYKKSIDLAQQRHKIYQELTTAKRRNTLAALELANNVREKQEALEFQKKIVNERNKELKQSRIFLAIIGILLIIVIIFLFQKKVQDQNEYIQSLISELHHRVKNNLQIISSLLGLQSMKLQDQGAKEAISEGKERIKAMSLIHERLYKNNNLSAVNLEEYLKELAFGVAYSFGFHDKQIFRFDTIENSIDLNKLMPLGLVLNELVSNSFKYAFHHVSQPEIIVSLAKDEDHYIFCYKDNGPGLPANFDFENSDSFGLKLIRLISKQLNATMNISNRNGLSVSLKIVKTWQTTLK